jgi:hypothetical protein
VLDSKKNVRRWGLLSITEMPHYGNRGQTSSSSTTVLPGLLLCPMSDDYYLVSRLYLLTTTTIASVWHDPNEELTKGHQHRSL